MKLFIEEFFNTCEQIRRKLLDWSHWLKKSLIENFIYCTVSEYIPIKVADISVSWMKAE